MLQERLFTSVRLVAIAVAATVAVGLALAEIPGSRHSPNTSLAGPAVQPNIIVIQTDDQTLASLNRKVMPATSSLLADHGTRFTNYVVSSPLCCPSRASLLTGQYPHNHGVLSNRPGYASLRNSGNTLPVWLQRAGYRTAHVGKYLNNYQQFAKPSTEAAPGWDQWATMLAPYSYYAYDLAINGARAHFGNDSDDYLTTVLNRMAARVVKRFVPDRKPLYLELDEFAPHGQETNRRTNCGSSAIQLSGDGRRFAHAPLPRPPSFNEADVSDKPPFVQQLPRLSPSRHELVRQHYRCRLASLRGVDRGVRRLHAALRKTGELHNTVIIFTSDNGFMQGEHRVPAQKAQAYDEAVRVPLIMRVPVAVRGGAPRVAESDEPIANIDLAPTILQLAGARPCRIRESCRVMDGRSLLGLVNGESEEWSSSRGILITFTNGHQRNGHGESCKFDGIRTANYSYVEYTQVPDPKTGSCLPSNQYELYNLRADPFELHNLHSPGPLSPFTVEGGLAVRLLRLESCAGIQGRDLQQDGRPFCE